MTGSRGGTLACVVTVGAVVVFCSASRTSKVALTVAAMLLLAAVVAFQPAGVGSRQVARTDSSSGRSDIWRVAAHACPQYCLTGAGWGTFPVVYGLELEQVPTARVLVQGVAYQPHDIFLLALMEAGLPGLLLLVAGLAAALFGAMRLPRSLRAPPTAALVGTIVSSIFLSNLEFKFVWAALAYPAMCGAVAAAERMRRTGAAEPDAPAVAGQAEADLVAAGKGA
jgi:O-antigen ligase